MDEQLVRETASATDTEAFGAELAAELRPGEVVLVSGELGSGKTTLVRGACRALGVREPVQSPSFVIGCRYQLPGGVEVSHLDLYRLGDLAGEEADLLADYLGPGRIAFVEWPGDDAATALGGVVRLRLELEHLGGERRRIEANWSSTS